MKRPRSSPTVCTRPPAPPPPPPREEWPQLKPAAKASPQSPWRTVLIVGEEGDPTAVRVIVEGRTRESVDQVARAITGL